MKISRYSVRRPILTLMVFLAAVVLGIVSYIQLPVQAIPDLALPRVGVYMNKPGASPEENIEELVKPVEAIISELPRVKSIQANSGSWGVWIETELESGADVRFATIDLQERLIAFQQNLKDRRTVIEVMPYSTDQFKNFMMEVSLQSDDDPMVLFDLMRDRVAPRLKTIAGVARVDLGGVISDTYEVELDSNRMAGFGLDFGRVFQRLQAESQQDNYVGSLEMPGGRYYVRLNSAVKNAEELGDIVLDNKGIVRLADVARIIPAASIDDRIYRVNGKNAIGATINREEGENLIRVANLVRERIAEINAELPEGTRLEIQFDIAEMVSEAIDQVKELALVGAVLALLVPLVFFRSWRIATIIFLSVPICIIVVFNLFYFFGMSINIFSIIGLALGVGMLVDNSIVVVENCFRLYFSRHMSAEAAAEIGGDEVGRALFASTLTSAVPFIALFFLDGDFKMFIKEPSLALVFPLLVSLGVALTLSAMLTAKALATIVRHRGERGEMELQKAARRLNPQDSRIRELYRYLLKGCLRHRGRVLSLISVVLVVVWLDACKSVREATSNREPNQEVVFVYLELPPGTTSAEADPKITIVEDRLATHEDVERFTVWSRGDEANFNLHLKKKKERPSGRTMEEIKATIVDFIGPVPGAEVSLVPPSRQVLANATEQGNRGVLVLKGLDLEDLEAHAERLIQLIELVPSVTSAKVVSDNQQDQYELLLDREKLRLFGMNARTLGEYIGITRARGQISSLQLKDGEEKTDVIITMGDRETESVQDVQKLPVYTATGSIVPLGELAVFQAASRPSSRSRVDRQSSLTLEYFWKPGGDAGAITDRIKEIIRYVPNPAGVSVVLEGQLQRIEQQRKDFLFSIIIGAVLIYVVMASIFESYWVPFTILATNPLMLVGIVAALAITGLPFEELAGFGVILLNGLAVNNGIVLMDRALRFRTEQNYRRLRAVFQASDQRLRPILMTYLTTTLGLLPMAVVGDETSQWRPVAVTVLGGLTSATFLTLLVLPCFYMIGDDFVSWAGPRWKYVSGRALAAWVLPVKLTKWAWNKIRRRKVSAPEAPPVIAETAVESETPVIAIRNVHLVYNEWSARELRRVIPQKGIPIGHRPKSGHAALKAIDLEIGRGLFGLLGPNGAGKTTLMRCIAGLLEPTRGTIRLFGSAQRDAGEQHSPLIGYLPQTQGLYEWMTLHEYLSFFARLTYHTIQEARALPGHAPLLKEHLDRLRPLSSKSEREAAIIAAVEEVNLSDFLHDKIGSFSGGMKQRAGIARVLLQQPPILIVDEPTAGLDPIERVNVRLMLSRLARERTVIFSTHIVEDLDQTCDALAILDRGELMFSGTPAELLEKWNNRVWQVPLNGDVPERLRWEISGRGGRILFRYAQGGDAGFRVIAEQQPHERGTKCAATLEDALLGTLETREGGN